MITCMRIYEDGKVIKKILPDHMVVPWIEQNTKSYPDCAIVVDGKVEATGKLTSESALKFSKLLMDDYNDNKTVIL